MKRLKEQEYDILARLQGAPGGLKFGELLEMVGSSPMELRDRLQRLIAYNCAMTDGAVDEARYTIAGHNEQIVVRKACCPICKTARFVSNAQYSAQCSNAECTNRGGLRRQYWLVNSRARRRGIIKPVNIVQ